MIVIPLIVTALLAPKLRVGMPAPSLEGAQWVKGNRPLNFRDGTVNIVEFWATWCAPCRESFSHLSRIARRYAGKVDVYGISVSEKDPANGRFVEDFVRLEGSRMDYNVGRDVPGKPVYATWMVASGSGYIPTAFIVNKQGRIAWIGNPYTMDPAVRAVVSGSGDPAKAMSAVQRQQDAIEHRLEGAARQGDLAKVLELRKELPDAVSMGPIYTLLKQNDPKKAEILAEAVINDPTAGMWQFIDITWEIIQPSGPAVATAVGGPSMNRNTPTKGDLDLAMRLMDAAESRADPSEDSRFVCLQYRSGVYARAGDYPNAAKTQQQIINLLDQNPGSYADQLKQAQKALESFRAGHDADQ
jgi:thiol-disulfide isomerase/thioredoxin